MLTGKSTKGMHPELVRRLRALAEEVGGISITSGYRSSEEQARLRRLYEQGRGSPANRPGTSNHEAVPWGPPEALAADVEPLKVSDATLHRAAGKHGLHFPIRGEPWHVQPLEAKSGKYTGRVLGPASEAPPPPPSDPWADLFVPVLVEGAA